MLSQASDDDAEGIARLHIASWQATYVEELSATFLEDQDLRTRIAHWRRVLAEGVAVLVTKDSGEVTGFVACGRARGPIPSSDEWEVYNLHVAPPLHGAGLGSRLFDAAARLALDQGARELSLWVVKTNRRARAFYERKGMRWDGGEQEHPLGAGEMLHEVRYRMSLPLTDKR